MVFDLVYVRNICGIRSNRVRSLIIKERYGFELSIVKKVECNVLKWFEHMERIGYERLVKSMY